MRDGGFRFRPSAPHETGRRAPCRVAAPRPRPASRDPRNGNGYAARVEATPDPAAVRGNDTVNVDPSP
jgi:hypothetical protein